MLCPRCGKESEGKWCPYCGAQLEIEENFGLNPYDQTQRLPRINSDGELKKESPYSDTGSYERESLYMSESENRDLDNFDPYGDYKDDENDERKKKILIASVSAAAILILAIILAIVFAGKSNDRKDIAIPSSSESAEIEELVALGEKYMLVGNYKEAEAVYGELIGLTDDADAEMIYKILYNYNLAAKELEDGNFKGAQKYLDKIPSEYPSYSIADDIETLSDDIARYKLASDIFDTVCELMDDGDYEEAELVIATIDESLLGSENLDKLKKFKEIIEESKQREEEADLTEGDAEILLKEYKAGYEQAVNSGNIDMAGYIQKGSALYNKVSKLIGEYSAKNTKISKSTAELGEVTRIDGTSWYVGASEIETYTDAEGKESEESYRRRYVVKYIEGDYYFTDME